MSNPAFDYDAEAARIGELEAEAEELARRGTFVLAFYAMDRVCGGPEEGGWWYDTGTLTRSFKIVKGEDKAFKLAARANRLLETLQRDKRSISSMAYDGGIYAVKVFMDTAPRHWPETRPHYE